MPGVYSKTMSENESVGLIHREQSLHFLLLILACSSQIVLPTVSDSFVPQEVISYDIPLERVLTVLPALLGRLALLVIQENPELIDVRRISFLSRNKAPVNFLELGSTFPCVSTSPQVSP